MKRLSALIFALLLASTATMTGAAAATAGTATMAKVPEAEKLVVPAGKLMRVDEGVFDLKIGRTIDLTNRRMLLSIRYGREQKCCRLTINGMTPQGGEVIGDYNWSIGSRIDLKVMESTEEFVQDKNRCFLDIVDIVDPTGAPGTATFRLFCQ